MKYNLFIKAFIIAIVAFGFSCLFYSLTDNVYDFSSLNVFERNSSILHKNHDYNTTPVTLDFAGVNRIEIKSNRADIIVHKSEASGKVDFSGDHDKTNIMTYKEGSTLKISFTTKKNFTLGCSNTEIDDRAAVLTVDLPKRIKDVSITTTSGDTKFPNGMYLDSLLIHSVSGDADLDNMKVKDVTINTVNGDIFYQGSSQNLHIKTVNGDMSITAPNLASTAVYDITSVSGDTLLQLPKDLKVNLKIQSISGEQVVRPSLAVEANDSIPSPSVNIKTISGDIVIP